MNPFFAKHKQAAIDTTSGTGLLPSVVLAQAALESGYGRSELASKHNNLFGIKAGPKQEAVAMRTREEKPDGTSYWITARFRTFTDPIESFRARLKMLLKPRYKEVQEGKTPQQQAYALQRAGYGTAGNYARALMAVIHSNGLEAIDAEAKKKEHYAALATLLELPSSSTESGTTEAS